MQKNTDLPNSIRSTTACNSNVTLDRKQKNEVTKKSKSFFSRYASLPNKNVLKQSSRSTDLPLALHNTLKLTSSLSCPGASLATVNCTNAVDATQNLAGAANATQNLAGAANTTRNIVNAADATTQSLTGAIDTSQNPAGAIDTSQSLLSAAYSHVDAHPSDICVNNALKFTVDVEVDNNSADVIDDAFSDSESFNFCYDELIHGNSDAVASAVGGGKMDTVDRTVTDVFLMSEMPSLGRYASLPSEKSFKQKGHPFGRLSKVAEHHESHSDHVKLQRMGDGTDSIWHHSKSNSNIDSIRRAEPKLVWLPLRSFGSADDLCEDAPDSAYQTSNTLKLDLRREWSSLSKEELRFKIESFNLNQAGLRINMEAESDIYHGSIRVLIDLVYPVEMRASSRPSSIYNLVTSEANNENELVTSFYLPKSYVTTIYISSETTADQVIKELLNKYNITNHSGRFALFEKINREPDEEHSMNGPGTVYLRKLSAEERPLELFLHWADQETDSLEQRQFSGKLSLFLN